MNILVVENDRALLDLLQAALSPRYALTQAESCARAEVLLESQPFDLILLDIQLPDGSGFAFCQALKTRPHPPVLMLTVFDDEASTLRGFESGADDYVTKPFSARILQARIQALLRRTSGAERLYSGQLLFDLDRHLVTRAGEEVHLLPTEYSLAELLIRQRGAGTSRHGTAGRTAGCRQQGPAKFPGGASGAGQAVFAATGLCQFRTGVAAVTQRALADAGDGDSSLCRDCRLCALAQTHS